MNTFKASWSPSSLYCSYKRIGGKLCYRNGCWSKQYPSSSDSLLTDIPSSFLAPPFHPLWEVKLQITSHQRAPTIQSLCWRNVYWKPWLGYNCEQGSSFSRRQLGPTFWRKRGISGQNNDLHLFQNWISQQSSSISRRQPTFSESVWESSFSFATTFRGVCRNLHNLA